MPNWFTRLFSHQQPVKAASAAILTQAPGGLGVFPPSLNRAQEQYRHNVGWPAVAVRAIAWRVAGQDLHVARFARRRGRKSIDGLPRSLKMMGDQPGPLDSARLL